MRDELDDDSDDFHEAPAVPEGDAAAARASAVARALGRYAKKLERKLAGLRDDLAEARLAPKWRRAGEALLAYAPQVPARAASVTLPDPADASRTLTIELDPAVGAPANAARCFKRAAKGERGQREIPARIAAVEAERDALRAKLDAWAAAAHDAGAAVAVAGYDAPSREGLDGGGSLPGPAARAAATLDMERSLSALGATLRQQIRAPEPLSRRELALPAGGDAGTPSATRPAAVEPRAGALAGLPARHAPWRFRTAEGWDVLIGRTSEGNDYLSTRLARPEDYWFHAHGCPGSHVVLRRGKGPNEPSKATLEEVASWAAFHSKARAAGKVPVHYTRAKYVRKPRGAKSGLVYIEHEKALLVRPVEPPKERMADAVEREPPEDGE